MGCVTSIDMSLEEIRKWFYMLKRRRALGDVVPTVSEIANRVGVSRQTIYALLRNERTQFGEVVQIRLSRVITQISTDPDFQRTRLIRVSFDSGSPSLKLGSNLLRT